MTSAIAEGRALRLEIEGGVEPFIVDPLPARRGKHLTDLFIKISVQGPEKAEANTDVGEAVFIESIGPMNYARMTATVVELVDSDDTVIAKWHPEMSEDLESSPLVNPPASTIYRRGGGLRVRETTEDEPELWGDPIRQEECEALVLCAFYWQTVVGMEAVNAFLENGEGTAGSLKALGLLLSRRGLWTPTNSKPTDGESSPPTDGSTETTATARPSAIERLPAAKRSKKPKKSR